MTHDYQNKKVARLTRDDLVELHSVLKRKTRVDRIKRVNETLSLKRPDHKERLKRLLGD